MFDTGDDMLIPLTLAAPFTSGSTVTLDVDSAALSIGFYRFTVPANAVSDLEVEPNDSLASATPLPLYEDPVGSGFLTSGIAWGSIDPASDERPRSKYRSTPKGGTMS